ncbi:MAG: PAS domain S-box protein [Mangrovibacterium sp.]
MFTELIKNSAVLIVLSILYGFLFQMRSSGLTGYKIVEGLLFGSIAIVAMEIAVHHPEGGIYDGRSIVMAISGLLGGPVTAGISVVTAGVYCLYLGGPGVWAGILTILTSAIIGLLFRRLGSNKPESMNILSLLGLGIVVHLFMLICQLLLPNGLKIIEEIWFPVLIVLPLGTLIMGILISEGEKRLLTEKALRQSEENFRRSMDESPLGMHIVSEKGETLYANQAFLSLYGFNTIEEYINTPSEKRYTPESFKQHLKRKEKRMKGEHVDPEYEIEIIRTDSQTRYLHVHRKVISWNGIPRFHVIYQDYTEKKEAEKQLQLLSRSVEQSPVGIVITSPSGYIEYINPKFTEMTGYTAEEVIGENPRLLKSGEHPKEFYQDLWATIKEGKEWRGEFQNKKKNGELYWENAIISPIFDEHGKIVHFVEAKEDITERKKMIADLKAAKEKVEESDRLKSSFLANISHEIRTPLNVILGFTEMLTHRDELTPETAEEYLSIIKRNADELLQSICNVLDMSKLEMGQVKIVKDRINIRLLLDELCFHARRRIEDLDKKQIRLIQRNPEVEGYVSTDKERLIQIFSHLLNNSIKFTTEGQIEFGVTDITKTHISFFVSDTGIGIEKSIQPALFKYFRQGDNSTTRLYGGTGLGLSIVKKLIELMEGEINLESEPGKGTTVKFQVPVH